MYQQYVGIIEKTWCLEVLQALVYISNLCRLWLLERHVFSIPSCIVFCLTKFSSGYSYIFLSVQLPAFLWIFIGQILLYNLQNTLLRNIFTICAYVKVTDDKIKTVSRLDKCHIAHTNRFSCHPESLFWWWSLTEMQENEITLCPVLIQSLNRWEE